MSYLNKLCCTCPNREKNSITVGRKKRDNSTPAAPSICLAQEVDSARPGIISRGITIGLYGPSWYEREGEPRGSQA